jgi:glycosyltransferase involved in cell wall biosynthesis
MTAGERFPGMVSVIMPFLDPRESFFREAIRSIEHQTCDNWELILVDDGSTAPISRLATEIAESRSSRIRYIEHEGHRNLGISASRNRGIADARGEFVAFLDADDVWDATQLEEQADLLARHPEAAMLYGNTLYWATWEGNPDPQPKDAKYELGVPVNRVLEPPTILRLILARRATPPCMTAVMVRRRVFDDGIHFEESFPVHYEDQVFMAKMACSHPIYVSGRCWGRYRQHGESVTADGDDTTRALAWRLKYLQWMAAYFDEAGIDDRRLRFLLWLETRVLGHRGLNALTHFYWRWRGRFRRLLAPLRSG